MVVSGALGSFLGSEITLSRVRYSVQRYGLVLRVSDLVKMHMRDLLVLD